MNGRRERRQSWKRQHPAISKKRGGRREGGEISNWGEVHEISYDHATKIRGRIPRKGPCTMRRLVGGRRRKGCYFWGKSAWNMTDQELGKEMGGTN